MPTILALDQGTTGSTALVVDAAGRVRGRGYREIPQFFPAPGQVEHDPDALFQSVVAAGRDAIAAADLRPDAIGITNQRETVVLWQRADQTPIGRAIVWQDRRTAARCDQLRQAGREPMIRARTGLVIDPYFSATKLEWLLRDEALRRRGESGEVVAGTVESWLVARLTGGRHVTDPTNGSRTMLMSLASAEWDAELLDLFGVPRQMLPEVVPSSGVLAEAGPEWFGAPLPIAALVGDQQAALFGQGCHTPGEAKITLGTGSFLLRYSGDVAPPTPATGILATAAVSASGDRAWALEGSNFIAGAAVQWLRDGLGLISDAAETEALARSVADSGGVSFVPAFAGLGAPHWNAAARGTITGLSRGSQRAHLVRATLEAIGHGTADLLGAMGGGDELRVDGGVAGNDWLMQYIADLLDCPVVRPGLLDLTGYGAARLAAVGLGASLPAAAEQGPADRFMPDRDAAWRERERAGWQRAIVAATAWAESQVYSPAQGG